MQSLYLAMETIIGQNTRGSRLTIQYPLKCRITTRDLKKKHPSKDQHVFKDACFLCKSSNKDRSEGNGHGNVLPINTWSKVSESMHPFGVHCIRPRPLTILPECTNYNSPVMHNI